jgi:hypothetical protein
MVSLPDTKRIRADVAGERNSLTRNIDFDPFDLTIEEKIFRGAKRVCIVFAVSAVTLSLLDLANIRTVENAAAFINDNRMRVADLPDRIRSGIDYISLEPESPSVTVAIPRDDIVKMARPVAVNYKAGASPVAGLAAARHQDAIEFAMEQPAKSELRIAAEPASVSALALEPIKLASADMGPLPADVAPAPVSLPMSTAMIPLDMVPMPDEEDGALRHP